MTTLDICNMALSSLGHERRVTDLAAQTKEAARLPFIPGVMTPSEVLVAREHGFTLMKLFPAAQAGGVAMLQDRKSTRLNSSHTIQSRMPSSA